MIKPMSASGIKVMLVFAALWPCIKRECLGQNVGLTVGTHFPLQYTIGMEYEFNKRITATINAGIVTKPYDQLILFSMKSLGTDAAITNTIGEAFSYGFVAQPGVSYSFKKYYAGTYFQYVYLQANDVPQDAIETYYGVTITPKRSGRSSSQQDLTVSSNLFNVGILFGRRFYFKNTRLQLRLELAVAKTIGSYSTVKSEGYELYNLSSLVNTELKQYYWTYGYIPTLNIFLVFKLNKS